MGSYGGSDRILLWFTILPCPPLAFVLLVDWTSLWRGAGLEEAAALSLFGSKPRWVGWEIFLVPRSPLGFGGHPGNLSPHSCRRMKDGG